MGVASNVVEVARKLFEYKTSSKSEHNEGRRWEQIKRAGVCVWGGEWGGLQEIKLGPMMLQERSTQVRKCSSIDRVDDGNWNSRTTGNPGFAAEI
jgi:hypothetical protein